MSERTFVWTVVIVASILKRIPMDRLTDGANERVATVDPLDWNTNSNLTNPGHGRLDSEWNNGFQYVPERRQHSLGEHPFVDLLGSENSSRMGHLKYLWLLR